MVSKSIIGAICACLAVVSYNVSAIPVSDISNLDSITFWERTGGTGPDDYTFSVGSAELTTRLTDPLSTVNHDIQGVLGAEFYDVFYSDLDGSFNIDGEYLTIEGTYSNTLPDGGGLNLAEIGLNFIGDSVEYGNFVASFTALGDNADPDSVNFAIDGDLLTHTTMGNTVGQTERLRITLGFLSSSGPPTTVPIPAAIWLFGAGLLGLIGVARHKKI